MRLRKRDKTVFPDKPRWEIHIFPDNVVMDHHQENGRDLSIFSYEMGWGYVIYKDDKFIASGTNMDKDVSVRQAIEIVDNNA